MRVIPNSRKKHLGLFKGSSGSMYSSGLETLLQGASFKKNVNIVCCNLFLLSKLRGPGIFRLDSILSEKGVFLAHDNGNI